MYKDLKHFFNDEFSHVKYNIDLYKQLESFRQYWITRSDSHIQFLNSNLLGVHEVRFNLEDIEILFYDILNVDYVELQKKLYTVKGINKNFKVSSNIYNQSIIYLLSRVVHSNSISAKDKEFYGLTCYYLYIYKIMSSLLVHRFKYTIEENIAITVFENLSNHYLIKKLGNWNNVFKYRGKDFINKNGIYYNRIKDYSKTKTIVDTINDSQGRVRSMVNNIFRITIEVNESTEYLKSQSLSQTDLEGNVGIRDIESKQSKMVEYIKTIIFVKEDFVKENYIYLITDIVKVSKKEDLMELLIGISNITDNNFKQEIQDISEKIITFSIQYLINKNMLNFTPSQIPIVLRMLKNYWMSSKTPNKDVLYIKKRGNEIVSKFLPKLYSNKISTTKTAMFIYLFLLAYIKVK